MVSVCNSDGCACSSAVTVTLVTSPRPLSVSVAMILTVPDAVPAVASPLLSMETTSGAEEYHSTGPDSSLLDPSEYWPPTLNCCCPPPAIEGLLGVIVIDCRTGAGG